MTIRPFDGIARKVSLPILVICAIGWLLYTIGFGWMQSNYIAVSQEDYDHDDYNEQSSPYRHLHRVIPGLATATGVNNYDSSDLVRDRLELASALILYIEYRQVYYCFSIVGPLMIIAMFIHLLIGHPAIGILTNFGVAIYIAAGGGILYLDGIIISTFNRIVEGTNSDSTLSSTEEGRYIILEFAGCFISVLFIGIHMCFWSAFTNPWPKTFTCSSQNRRDAVTHTTTIDTASYPVATTYQPAGQMMRQGVHMVPVVSYPPPGSFVMPQSQL